MSRMCECIEGLPAAAETLSPAAADVANPGDEQASAAPGCPPQHRCIRRQLSSGDVKPTNRAIRAGRSVDSATNGSSMLRRGGNNSG
eukprot:6197068-Prymnesium_polylepis.1